MRLICTSEDQQKGYVFSSYLKEAGIDNLFEVNTVTDWGSPDYGNSSCRIWVYDEDQFEKAIDLWHDFEEHPSDPKFQALQKKPLFRFEPVKTTLKITPKVLKTERVPPSVEQPLGLVTLYILVICSLIFLVSSFTSPAYVEPPKNLPLTPLYSSHLYKSMYYDYPEAYEIVDQLASKYGIEKLRDIPKLPPEGQTLYDKFLHTPYWQGFYPKIVSFFKEPKKPITIEAPLFEKEHQGEVWRLFTPALLHNDIFHIFFNMIWLIVLGRQMEHRLGAFRYLLFLLITGIVTNTAQYLMSGPNFIGFSGILCAMLTFIWVRMKKTAWEGYLLQESTMLFLMFFIFTIAAIQLVSFFMEINNKAPFVVAIANTAHITGLIIGAILGRMNFFAWKGQ